MKIWPFPRSEKKSLGNPTEAEYALFTGGSVAGSTVSLATALTVPAVQSSIRLISEASATLDIIVERRDGNNWTRETEHPVARLLADRPNDWTSTFELIRDLVATALTHDRGGIAWVNRVGDEVREIVRYEPDHVTVDFSADGRQEPSFKINNRAEDAQNIVHLRGPFGRSCLALAAGAIGAAKDMEGHASKLFKNGARPGGVIQSPKPLGDEGFKKMGAAWRAAHEGPDNAGRTAILWDGATWQAMTLTSTDAQFLENRKFQIIEIARAFRVPPSMIYDLDRATWSNSEQMGKEFLSYTLEPWLRALEGALRRALFLPEERGDFRIRFDRDDLTRADLNDRATAINSLIASRVLNPNEGRAWLDLPPRDGGEEYANPNTGSNQPGLGHNGGPALDDQTQEPGNGPE
ncbi:phage portal protein [Martelella radicis]|uniref:HK97 family phage portal protein n=1 Tax=Martelella radicis TaxID=1397476 RepID=A0A7W6PBB1_9HYPH|nr:phage portal protein [Martelella radicis]MBB4123296.1 HK97 family phage portal protein [Martelella radicis]